MALTEKQKAAIIALFTEYPDKLNLLFEFGDEGNALNGDYDTVQKIEDGYYDRSGNTRINEHLYAEEIAFFRDAAEVQKIIDGLLARETV